VIGDGERDLPPNTCQIMIRVDGGTIACGKHAMFGPCRTCGRRLCGSHRYHGGTHRGGGQERLVGLCVVCARHVRDKER
jgi:hypothetical protein